MAFPFFASSVCSMSMYFDFNVFSFFRIHTEADGCNEGAIVITQEEMDKHNQSAESGAWTIMHGKVYNLDALSKQVNSLVFHSVYKINIYSWFRHGLYTCILLYYMYLGFRHCSG